MIGAMVPLRGRGLNGSGQGLLLGFLLVTLVAGSLKAASSGEPGRRADRDAYEESVYENAKRGENDRSNETAVMFELEREKLRKEMEAVLHGKAKTASLEAYGATLKQREEQLLRDMDARIQKVLSATTVVQRFTNYYPARPLLEATKASGSGLLGQDRPETGPRPDGSHSLWKWVLSFVALGLGGFTFSRLRQRKRGGA